MGNQFEELVAFFATFPGIGKRQARRFAYFIARTDPRKVEQVSTLLTSVSKKTKRCAESAALFYTDDPTATLSPLARDTSRNRSQLLIVEKDTDLETVEKSGTYNGTYFVLGGSIPILEKKPKERIRLSQLKNQLKERSNEIKEIILGLSMTPQGQYTEEFLSAQLDPLQKTYGFTLSSLGKGISTGTEIEYSDTETLKNALQRRISH